MRWPTRSVLLLFMFLVSALPVRAANPAPVHESSEVSLVEVPVTVVGADGKPVANLTAADFELEEEGQRRQISDFDVVDLRRQRVLDGAEPPSPAGRRHFMLLFDFSYATANEIFKSRLAALHFIQKEIDSRDFVSIAQISVENGAHVLVSFTADRTQLLAAVVQLGLPRTTDQSRDPLAFAFVTPGDPNKIYTADSETFSSNRENDTASTIRLMKLMAQKESDNYNVTRIQRQLVGLGGLAQALDAVEGRKIVMYFSEGFDGRLLVGNLHQKMEEQTIDNDAMFRGQYWATDLERRYTNSSLQRQMTDTIEYLRRSDCVVYPIDIGGLQGQDDVAMGQMSRGEDSLVAFAVGTGGEVLGNGNDFEAQMRRILEKTSLTYVLWFKSDNSKDEGKFRRLKVRVRVKGARVSARAGFYSGRRYREMTPLERVLSAADVVTREQSSGEMPIGVLAVPFADERISRVPVVVSIPGSSLPAAPTSADGTLRLGIYVYITETSGKLADYFTRGITVDLAKDGERIRRGGITYYSICRLLPGSYRVRAFVRDEESGRFGFRVSSLEVPAFAEEKMHALPPFFISETSRGLNLRDTTSSASDSGEPFQVGESAFVPRIVPGLSPGVASRICLMLYKKEEGSSSAPFELTAEIRDETGRVRGTAQLSLIGRSSPDAAGLVKLLVNFVPSELPAGDYSLRVLFRDVRDRSLHSESEASFTVS